MASTPEDEPHRRLDILAGVWDSTITMLNADDSEGEVSQAIDAYKWMPNGHFLLHDVDATMKGESVQSLEIIAIDTATGQFTSRSYDPDGSMHDFTSRIEGRAYRIDGKLQRFSGEFSADGTTLRGKWEQRVDGAWVPFVRMLLRKRPE